MYWMQIRMRALYMVLPILLMKIFYVRQFWIRHWINTCKKIPVRKGDVYYIPAGTVHGIGAGILLAEIQQSSNVTYRVYDYDRQDKDGNKRELHLEKAIKVLNMDVSQDVSQGIRLINYYPGCSRQIVCRCKYFDVEKVEASIGFDFSVLETSFQY